MMTSCGFNLQILKNIFIIIGILLCYEENISISHGLNWTKIVRQVMPLFILYGTKPFNLKMRKVWNCINIWISENNKNESSFEYIQTTHYELHIASTNFVA